MPNIKSAKKRVKVNKRQHLENSSKKSALRTTIKKATQDIQAGNDSSSESLKLAIKALDRAAANKLIHKNAAARKISRLTKAFNASKK